MLGALAWTSCVFIVHWRHDAVWVWECYNMCVLCYRSGITLMGFSKAQDLTRAQFLTSRSARDSSRPWPPSSRWDSRVYLPVCLSVYHAVSLKKLSVIQKHYYIWCLFGVKCRGKIHKTQTRTCYRPYSIYTSSPCQGIFHCAIFKWSGLWVSHFPFKAVD